MNDEPVIALGKLTGEIAEMMLTIAPPPPVHQLKIIGPDGVELLVVDLAEGTVTAAVEDRMDEAARIFLEQVRWLLGNGS